MWGQGFQGLFNQAARSGLKRIFAISCFLLLITFLASHFLAETSAATTYITAFTISDDATGGQCTLIGTWDAASKTCTLTQDLNFGLGSNGLIVGGNGITIDGDQHALSSIEANPTGIETHGVYVNGKSSVTIKNLKIKSFYYGISVLSSSNSTLLYNWVYRSGYDGSDSFGHRFRPGLRIVNSTAINVLQNETSENGNGLFLNYARNCLIKDNTFIDSTTVLSIYNSTDNTIYHNAIRFSTNYSSSHDTVYVQGSGGNVFNVAEGGNYWQGWTAPDSNADGFVDLPYVHGGATDNLPLIRQAQWETVPPVVTSVKPAGEIYRTSAVIEVSAYDPRPSSLMTISWGSINPVLTLDGNPVGVQGISSGGENMSVSTYQVTGMSLGTHTIGGYLVDNNGNMAPISGTFTIPFIDSTAPSASYTGPFGFSKGRSTTVTATFDDPPPSGGIDPETAKIKMNGSVTTPCSVSGSQSGTISCPVSGLNEQDNTAVITFADKGGNQASVTGTFHSAAAEIVIMDDATGGDCTTIGSWHAESKTCVMNTDLSTTGLNGIDIIGNDITLEGAGHRLTSDESSPWSGIYVGSQSGAVIRNLDISHFYIGISLINSPLATVNRNSIQGKQYGITIWGNNALNQVISDNYIVAGSDSGVGIGGGSNIIISDNFITAPPHDAYHYDGIYIQGGNGVSIVGNFIEKQTNGMQIRGGNTEIRANTLKNNSTDLYLLYGGNNTISFNTLRYLWIDSSYASSHNNTFYGNNLDSAIAGTADQVFNLPAPIGGNYWKNWTGPDADEDGFIDVPYVFTGGRDNLPRTTPASMAIARPSLTLTRDDVFWASYADYVSRLLSVSLKVSNTGDNPVVDARITECSNTSGVSLFTVLPVVVGNMPGSSSNNLTLVYHVPAGVPTWRTTIRATALDAGGMLYRYPG